ncbi:MAG: TonB-dependent receptor, partial [Bacteroidetes bacterium]|nr:TonB-dependent receptor [Bacteroidota bacterium]
NYSVLLAPGTYWVRVSMMEYPEDSVRVTVKDKDVYQHFGLRNLEMQAIEVVADIVVERKTPVAVSTLDGKELREEIAGRDIVNVMANTPSVYSTQSGGGAGESRVNVRGFDQRNIAVLIDGMPVNDMENGQVYWSNWLGLQAVTRTMQMQRGLSATKLALPAVGGTMNVITKGLESRQNLQLRQEIGNNGFTSSNLLFTSGRLKGNWGFTVNGTYRRSDGWVTETGHEAVFWFARLDKQLGRHNLALTGMGTWQKSEQRPYYMRMQTLNEDYARALYDLEGSPISPDNIDRGMRYNDMWGMLNGEARHVRINRFHKPQVSLRDYWTLSSRLFWSNVLYLSRGQGGSTLWNNTIPVGTDGQRNMQQIWDAQSNAPAGETGERLANTILRWSKNEHIWYGWLSTLNYKITEKLQFSGGLDMRDYTGSHYQSVADLLGGTVFRPGNTQADPGWSNDDRNRRIDDTYGFYNDGKVRWLGAFAQIEWSNDKWSIFGTFSGAANGYKRIDYFRRDIVLPDTIIRSLTATQINRYDNVGYTYNGRTYHIDDPEVRVAETDWAWFPTAVLKAGSSYQIDDNHMVFMNVGYFTKAPRFDNVYYFDNRKFRDIENEEVRAIEGGYNARFKTWALSVNAYYTTWLNKPVEDPGAIEINNEVYRYNINGLSARHMGLEVESTYKLGRDWELQAYLSLGDWIWNSGDTVRITDDNGNEVAKRYFSAEGVHVGDAPQTQVGASLRYSVSKGILKGFYIKPRWYFYDRHWANFDPLSLTGANADRDSWRAPSYSLVHLFAGYRRNTGPLTWNLQLGITNLLDAVYISDARNNNFANGFNARSAGVFFGLGRQYNLSLTLDINPKK